MFEFRVRADRQDFRDYVYQPRSTEPRQSVDLRPWCSPIEDQLHLGSCVGQAIVGAFELMVNKLYSDRFIDLSRLFVYYNARLYDNLVDEDVGAYMRDGIKAVKEYGVCSEQLWPYNVQKFSTAPGVDCYIEAKNRIIRRYYRVRSSEDVVNAVNENYPVVISMSVYNSFYDLELPGRAVLALPQLWEEMIGGHAVCIVGYDLAKKQFTCRNSFGLDWGDQGYFYMPFSYVTNNVWDSWIFDIELL